VIGSGAVQKKDPDLYSKSRSRSGLYISSREEDWRIVGKNRNRDSFVGVMTVGPMAVDPMTIDPRQLTPWAVDPMAVDPMAFAPMGS